MRKIDWQGFKKITGVFTWVSVTLMLLYHIHQGISQARSTANRPNENLVTLRSRETQATRQIPISIVRFKQNNRLRVDNKFLSLFSRVNHHHKEINREFNIVPEN